MQVEADVLDPPSVVPTEAQYESSEHWVAPAWRRLRTSGVLLVTPALIGLGLLFFAPLVRVFWQSLNEHVDLLGQTHHYFGFGNYESLFTDGYTLHIVLRTITVSAIIAVIAGFIAYPFAYGMTIVSTRARALLATVVLVPLWTSALARTFAWFILMNDGGPIDKIFHVTLRGTPLAVTIAMCQVLLPFIVLPMYSVMQGIDRKLLAAGESLGASRFTSFWRIYFPLSLPGVTTGVTLAFVLSLGFYLTPALLGSSQNAFIAQLIIIRTQLLDLGGASALAMFVLALTLVVLGIGAVVTRAFTTKSSKTSIVRAGAGLTIKAGDE